MKTVSGKGKRKSKKILPAREKAKYCAIVALEHKAIDLILLRVEELSSFADYFVICTGKSSRHVLAISEHIEEALREKGVKPLGIEGRKQGHWVLLDYDNVIVHFFCSLDVELMRKY